MRPGALDLLVFREDRRSVRGERLKSELLANIQDLSRGSPREQILRALLRAGELECSIADSGSIPVQPYTDLTDRLADALVNLGCFEVPSVLVSAFADAPVPEELEVSAPEGFAYYALHPLAFAGVLEKIHPQSDHVAVVGIRSIGSTLSAVTAAAARARGWQAERTTVRPCGHPYNRYANFSSELLLSVRKSIKANTDFLVVDEGPGLSGSSFLSVAEALIRAGAAPDKITLVCGHPPEIDSLRTDDGPCRARRFRWVPVSSAPRRPPEAEVFLGGGEWRSVLLPDASVWPASWIALERLKYLSSSHWPEQLFKFAGLGHHGEQVLKREQQLAAEGFAVLPHSAPDGFASYRWPAGQPMSADDLDHDVLRRLAAYCAVRVRTLPADLSNLHCLQRMADHNAEKISLGMQARLELEQPVIADGRMQPHEWLRDGAGRILKADCGSHGDDHFFPGPTDIAWDLAGAIVEWKMRTEEKRLFLEEYRRASGDDASSRIDDFVVAYTLFRCAYCLMAANAMHGTEEQTRLERAAEYYRPIANPAPLLATE